MAPTLPLAVGRRPWDLPVQKKIKIAILGRLYTKVTRSTNHYEDFSEKDSLAVNYCYLDTHLLPQRVSCRDVLSRRCSNSDFRDFVKYEEVPDHFV